ncbi:MAG: hypothetical protein JO007_16730 [Alphaproteobacteria bacterium]|nr:hypothetical protein [Alphaproteobacteria bacterium]
MLVNLVLIPARTYVRMRSEPFPTIADMTHDILRLRRGWDSQTPAVYLPILGVIAGLASLLASGRKSRPAIAGNDNRRSPRRWLLLQLTVFSVLFFFKGWVRPSANQMALAIVPALVVIAVCGVEFQPRARKLLPALAVGCVAVISLAPLLDAASRFTKNLIWAADLPVPSYGFLAHLEREGGTCSPPAGLEQIRCFYVAEDEVSAALYIQRHTSANEHILVANGRNDKAVLQDVLFYFIADRSPVTKWYQFDPGVQTTQEIQSDMIAELQKQRPRYVVLNSEWDNNNEPNESAVSGSELLDRYIWSHYQPVAWFGEIRILKYS